MAVRKSVTLLTRCVDCGGSYMHRRSHECPTPSQERFQTIPLSASTDKETTAPQKIVSPLLILKLAEQHARHFSYMEGLSWQDEEDLERSLCLTALEALPKLRHPQAAWAFLDVTMRRAALRWLERRAANRAIPTGDFSPYETSSKGRLIR